MKKNNESKLNTIEYKMVISFLIIVSVMLFLMWGIQMIFFDAMYKDIKESELNGIGSEIVSISMQSDYEQQITDISIENNVDVIVLRYENENDYEFIYKNNRISDENFIKIVKGIISNLYINQTMVKTIEINDSHSTMIYATNQAVGGQNYYFFVYSIVTPLDATNEIFIRLLIVNSILSLVIAVLFSYFFAKKLSNPIKDISQKAKELSTGNLNVMFDVKGYEEVNQLQDTLNYAIAEIKKSDNFQKEMISNVSHELKTPLTMIKSYTELIKDISGENKEKRTEHLNVIYEETERLEYIVNDMLDLSKMQAKTMKFNYSDFDLVEILKKYKNFYEEKFQQKGYKFDFILCDKCTINADKNRIEQVVINFINNAINYSLDKKEITIKLEKNNDIALLTIIDKGMGMSESEIENIYKRHFRAVDAQRVTVGSGIGLSICKEILDYHNLEYGVKSQIGVGSEFFVKFKIKV